MKKWVAKLIDTVAGYWDWNGHPCAHLFTHVVPPEESDMNAWEITLAPPLQEIEGGPEDGHPVWTPFAFDLGSFIAHKGVQQCMMAIRSQYHQTPPLLLLDLLYQNRPVLLRILLEPPPGVESVELVNYKTKQVRHKCQHPDHEDEHGRSSP
jgi:hypothetical protein